MIPPNPDSSPASAPALQPVPLVDLLGQTQALRAEIDAAVARTLDSGWYILGKEVAAFEAEFAAYITAHGGAPVGCIGVNSGTDALHLALLACGVGPGDEVITVAHTAVATAAAIRLAGATPVFVDVDPATYTLDPAALAAAITPATKAVIPVHVYGHPADLDAILSVARGAGLRVIEDCAQAHGAIYRGRHVGAWGDLGCFSFYPTKNLGALGDGGAVISTSPALVEQVRLLREYGWTPQARYVSQVVGMNSRLDELQAAILRAKLPHLDAWNGARRALAAAYAAHLPAALALPVEQPTCRHVYHLYVVRVAGRDGFRRRLQAAGIGTGIHYPVPIHRQPAYAGQPGAARALPQTERLAGEIVSLPMHPQLTVAQIAQVAAAAQAALDEAAA
jgi:dTDP-4-amino-4,6-dideoxygalactose transaminase